MLDARVRSTTNPTKAGMVHATSTPRSEASDEKYSSRKGVRNPSEYAAPVASNRTEAEVMPSAKRVGRIRRRSNSSMRVRTASD